MGTRGAQLAFPQPHAGPAHPDSAKHVSLSGRHWHLHRVYGCVSKAYCETSQLRLCLQEALNSCWRTQRDPAPQAAPDPIPSAPLQTCSVVNWWLQGADTVTNKTLAPPYQHLGNAPQDMVSTDVSTLRTNQIRKRRVQGPGETRRPSGIQRQENSSSGL